MISIFKGILLLLLIALAVNAYQRYDESIAAERGKMSEINRTIAGSPEFGDGYRRGILLGEAHRAAGKAELEEEDFDELREAELKESGRAEFSGDWKAGFEAGFEDGVEKVRLKQQASVSR